MPRTAITTVLTHKGEERAVHLRKVSIIQQKAEFRAIRGDASHPEIAEVYYQESDGPLLIHRYRSPEDHAENEKRRSSENEAAIKAGEELVKASENAAKSVDQQKIEAQEAEIARLNKLNLEAPNRKGAKAAKESQS